MILPDGRSRRGNTVDDIETVPTRLGEPERRDSSSSLRVGDYLPEAFRCGAAHLNGLGVTHPGDRSERSVFRDGHSVRSAVIGSTRAARQAGIMDATKAPRPSTNVAIVSITGSHGCTPNS